MPIPGPRTQRAPLPGYRNPDAETPTKFQLWDRPEPVAQPGRSPGLSLITLRGCVLAPGQIRVLWRQSVNLISAQAAYSWTRSAPSPEHPASSTRGVDITRALRYRTRSVYIGGGIDNSRFAGLHTAISPRGQRSLESRGRRVTVAAGSVRGRPTIRNRLTSFGSRVPTLNQPVQAADGTASSNG